MAGMLTAQMLRQQMDVEPSKAAELEMLARSTVRLLERKTGRLWERREGLVHRVRLDSVADKRFWVPLYPVETLSLADADGTLVSANDFSVDPAVGAVERSDSLATWSTRLLTATITGGYTAETCPEDVIQAMIVQARFSRARSAGPALVTKSQAFDKGSTSYLDPELHPTFVDVVRDYERHV